MKKILLTTLPVLALCVTSTRAEITYVDADATNTTFAPLAGGETAWKEKVRDNVNGPSVYSASATDLSPEGTTTIAITDGTYNLYAYFWDKPSTTTPAESWNLAAGLTSGSLVNYGDKYTIAPLAVAGDFAAPTPVTADGTNRDLYQIHLGQVTVTGGSVDIFFDHVSNTTNRSFYDGVGYESVPVLSITPNASTPGNYDFEWDSQEGKLYDLVSDTVPGTTAPADWPVWLDNADIPSGGTSTSLTNVPGGSDPTRFFAVVENNPPPITVFSENFDEVTAPDLPAEWTSGRYDPADTETTEWELGAPSSVGPTAADSTPNCVATNIGAEYGFDTDIWLRTPPIDLTAATAATLEFNQFRDIENDAGIDFDFGSIHLLAADDLTELAVLEPAVEGSDTEWQPYSKGLPTAALDEPILIEFRFESDYVGNFAGWYVDDVVITVAP